MICKNCGKEINDGAAFCSSCGAKSEVTATDSDNLSANNVTNKKKYPTKLVIGAIIAAIVILVIGIVVSIGDDETSDNLSSTKTNSSANSFFEDTVGDSEENVIKSLAISAIQNQPGVQHDEDVYDVEILEKDGNFNYIVGANTDTKSGIDQWWRVLIKIDTKTGKMQTTVKTTGEHIAKDEWIEKFKTESEYGWGKENNIE